MPNQGYQWYHQPCAMLIPFYTFSGFKGVPAQNRGGDMARKPLFFSHMQGLPVGVARRTNQWYHQDAQSNSATTSGGKVVSPQNRGELSSKNLFFSHMQSLPWAWLETNQWYHQMRNQIPQQLLGVRLSHLKTGGRYGSKNLFFSHMQGLPLSVLERNQWYHRIDRSMASVYHPFPGGSSKSKGVTS